MVTNLFVYLICDANVCREWDSLCRQAFFAQDVIRASNNPDMYVIRKSTKTLIFIRRRLSSIVMKDIPGPFKEIIRFSRWVWFVKLNYIFLRAMAILCALLSVIILWSETTSAFKAPNDTILSIVGVIFNAPGLTYTLIEVCEPLDCINCNDCPDLLVFVVGYNALHLHLRSILSVPR
jgi:hypothetical protein